MDPEAQRIIVSTLTHLLALTVGAVLTYLFQRAQQQAAWRRLERERRLQRLSDYIDQTLRFLVLLDLAAKRGTHPEDSMPRSLSQQAVQLLSIKATLSSADPDPELAGAFRSFEHEADSLVEYLWGPEYDTTQVPGAFRRTLAAANQVRARITKLLEGS